MYGCYKTLPTSYILSLSIRAAVYIIYCYYKYTIIFIFVCVISVSALSADAAGIFDKFLTVIKSD